MRDRALLFVPFLALAILAPGVAARAQAPADDAPFYDMDMETALAKWVNQQRAATSLGGLKLDDRLTMVARGHVSEEAQRGQVSAQYPNEPALKVRLGQVMLHAEASAESGAMAADLAALQQQLSADSPERRNLLNPGFNALGVALMRNKSKVFVVFELAKLALPTKPEEAEAVFDKALADWRQQAKRPGLGRIRMDTLRDIACQMAKKDAADAHDVPPIRSDANTVYENARAVAYTTDAPDVLPDMVTGIDKVPGINAYAVGMCFAKSATYPAGTIWVVAVFSEKKVRMR